MAKYLRIIGLHISKKSRTFAPRKPKHLWLKLGAQQKNKDYEYNDQEHFN